MPISNKIDGEWRALYTPYANIGGEWKPGDIYVKENGVWKNLYRYIVTESDVACFRLVYKLSTNMNHPLHPQLVNNADIPASLLLAGKTLGNMDLNEKGIIFEYSNDNPEIEGIKMYEGSLYAVTNENTFIDICHTESVGDVLEGKIPDVDHVFGCERLKGCTITVEALLTYQCFGYYMAGWNSLFNQNQIIDTTVFPDKGPHEGEKTYRSYPVLPYDKRVSAFFPSAQIGIARDMTSSMTNMVGNHGRLSQTVSSIRVNNVQKPFSIEIYE